MEENESAQKNNREKPASKNGNRGKTFLIWLHVQIKCSIFETLGKIFRKRGKKYWLTFDYFAAWQIWEKIVSWQEWLPSIPAN